jgi:stage V sporulation protein G
MQITRIVVRPMEKDSKVRATASVTFDDVFVVHDIRIIEGDRGLFIAMPSRKLPNGNFKDVAHPLNQETREMIQSAVLAEYEKAVAAAPAATEEASPEA